MSADDDNRPWKPSGRSHLVRELCSLTPNQKRLLHLTNGQLQISEAIFEACSALIDDTDPRLLVERIEDLSKLLPSFEFHEK